jgi:hypothetical protein
MRSFVSFRSPNPASAVVLAAALWAAAVLVPHAAKTDINITFDKAFAFTGLNTWAWDPDGRSDVRMAVSSHDNPERVASRVDPIIVPAIERELAARRFTLAEPEQAPLHLHYYVLATVDQSAQTQGQFVPAVTGWALPPFLQSTTALSIYPVGTLIVDIRDVKGDRVVWRGSAERKINVEKPDSERRKILESAIKDLFKSFPPKK